MIKIDSRLFSRPSKAVGLGSILGVATLVAVGGLTAGCNGGPATGYPFVSLPPIFGYQSYPVAPQPLFQQPYQYYQPYNFNQGYGYGNGNQDSKVEINHNGVGGVTIRRKPCGQLFDGC
jgi:hypothetical protein